MEVVMNRFAQKVSHFLKSEDGPTAVEYAVMLALIIVVALTAITTVGTGTRDMFDQIGSELSGTGGSTP